MSKNSNTQNSKNQKANKEKACGLSNNQVFKITLTAIYNSNGITYDQISDKIFNSMIGNGLLAINVNSITKVRNPEKIFQQFLVDASEKKTEDLSRGIADNGSDYISF